jgi:hypothetical protein
MGKWLGAGGALVGAVLAGLVLSRVVRSVLAKPNRPEALRTASGALASLVLSLAIVFGLVVALGVVAPDLLETIPEDLVRYLPKVLAAALLMIGGRVVAVAAEVAVGRATARSSPATQRRAVSGVRTGVLLLAGLLAVGQIGIDTTIVTLLVAGAVFAVAATFTLLVGFGGREVAAEVAAARVLRRSLHEGDQVTLGAVSGQIVAVHETAVELRGEDGASRLVPASRFLHDDLLVRRRNS